MTVSRVVLLAVAATGAWASDTTQAAERDIHGIIGDTLKSLPDGVLFADPTEGQRFGGGRCEG